MYSNTHYHTVTEKAPVVRPVSLSVKDRKAMGCRYVIVNGMRTLMPE